MKIIMKSGAQLYTPPRIPKYALKVVPLSNDESCINILEYRVTEHSIHLSMAAGALTEVDIPLITTAVHWI
jgi:hypothetical protein